MTARCEDCGRRLKRPSPDGLGRKCRRKRRANAPARTEAATVPRPLDHAALAAAGQLTIPIQQALAVAVPSRRRRGRRVIDVPGPDTWTEETA